MKNLLASIIDRAQKNPRRIVFPEWKEVRTAKAIRYLKEHLIVTPILPDGKTGDLDGEGLEMLKNEEADGMVSGATSHSGDLLLKIFRIIGTEEKFHRVSGVFFMVFKKKLLLFADCSVMISPESHDLMQIALDTAKTAETFDISSRIAFLSFSTHGSSEDSSLRKIRDAVKLTKNANSSLVVDGEIQLDAAIIPEIAKIKCPDSPLKGEANVLIFPDLNSANIGYKLCERLAKASAIGPILQGLKKPVNDLSRGCKWMDIVHTAAITACQSLS